MVVSRCVWGGVLAAVVLLLTSAAHAECTKDTDCKGDRICDAGVCQAPPVAAEAAAPAQPVPTTEAAAPPASAPVAPVPAPAPVVAKPPDLEPKMKPQSTGLMVAGVVALTASAITFYAGYVALIAGGTCDSYDREYDDDCRDHQRLGVGLSLATLGLIGAGIPMIVVGSKRVREDGKPTATISPWLGAREGGLQLRLKL